MSPAELLARHEFAHKPLSKALLACATRSPYPLVFMEIQLRYLKPELYQTRFLREDSAPEGMGPEPSDGLHWHAE